MCVCTLVCVCVHTCVCVVFVLGIDKEQSCCYPLLLLLPALCPVAILPIEKIGKGMDEGDKRFKLRPWIQKKLREGEEKQESHWTLLLESAHPI